MFSPTRTVAEFGAWGCAGRAAGAQSGTLVLPRMYDMISTTRLGQFGAAEGEGLGDAWAEGPPAAGAI